LQRNVKNLSLAVVTRRSYDMPGSTTDKIVLEKMKRKLGNNSYTFNRASRSPRTPKSKANPEDN
jgi:hypothetical protein